MNDKVLNEAVENISLIKGVIERTSRSFAGFSKVFTYWGILFIFNSIIQIVMQANMESIMETYPKYPVLNFIFPMGVVVVIAALIYKSVSKKLPLIGLEKHLMILWLLILLMNVIPQKITVNTGAVGAAIESMVVHVNDLSPTLLSLAAGLIITSLFTGLKQLKYVGIVYIIMSIVHAFFNIPMFSSDSFTQLIHAIPLPFTFLYTGFQLKSHQGRGE